MTLVDEICQDVAIGDMSPVEALAELRAKGLTPDREALSEAVAAVQLRDRFLDEQGDPYAYVGVDGPVAGGPNIWVAAVKQAETELCYQLTALARPLAAARAS